MLILNCLQKVKEIQLMKNILKQWKMELFLNLSFKTSEKKYITTTK
ncbi:260R [Invertebrate iridescent virus 6]|uniref:260R n=1 Tax=Invertebrate iridescent virus 6 TaxID=176652 RepID=Q91FR2_IIV6|nr:260R [Invertebrate iridescent virus 6]AAK82121.1 260R [Invertebrate iridescent virus 6]QMS79544.1 hypothetical protein IIV6-T1_255 [Invertebrate iridescent virus 6]